MANRLNINYKQRRLQWLIIGLVLLFSGIVVWLTAKTPIKALYTEISRGVDSSLLSESGQFDHQTLKRFSLQLSDEHADGFRRIIDANPGFLQQLERDLSSVVINYPTVNDQTHHQYLLAVINLVFSLQLIAEKPVDLQHFLQHSQDINTLLSLMLRPAEDGWSIAKEERVASAAKLIALQTIEDTTEGTVPGRTLPDGISIDELYFQAKDQRSAYRIAERGLLQAMWLRSVVPNFGSTGEFTDSISLAFEAIKTEPDLIRLLSHENAIVALGAARTVSLLVPEHALPAIRYQLVKSSNRLSLEQSFALLDALAAYGEQGRIAEPQLKKMIMLTRNDQLRNKIQHTLDHLYGRAIQDG